MPAAANQHWLAKLRRRAPLALSATAGCVLALAGVQSMVSAKPPKPSAARAAKAAAAAASATAPAPAVAGDVSRIYFTTVPPAHATVTWGKRVLGRIVPRQALTIVRPRDSGPLDVVVRAAGYLPVQTRAHTFAAETRVAVKLTPVDQKSTVLGYRAPLDAGIPVVAPLESEPLLFQATPP